MIDHSKTFEIVKETNPNDCYHILIREWDPESWLLGPLYEVRVDKNLYANKFAAFLTEKVFPHIPSDNLFCCKVTQLRNFKRGDLVLRRWSKLKTQATWLGQSTIEINRDSVYVVVKDNFKKVREELTEEEFKKYAS